MKIDKEEIKYIDGKKENGIIVDWKKVKKYYDQLNCPKDIYNPSKELDFDAAEWFILISTRSTGKTTNIILIGMILFQMYGIVVPYIRQTEMMTQKQYVDELLSVILSYRYIEAITDGKYNNYRYFGHKMFLIKLDEDGNRIDQSEAFMYMLDLTAVHVEGYKSTLNLPTGDFVVFDEFIASGYRPNEFISLCDLLKTIFRDRLTGKIFMLANTTDYYNEYLKELYIQDEVLKVSEDEPFVKLTKKKTRIYCHLIGNRNLQRAKVNTLYFGFDNPKLASITGGAWAIENYQHYVPEDERQIITRDFYLTYAGKLLQLELSYTEKLGFFVFVHRCKKMAKSAIHLYTIGDITDKKDVYKFGNLPIDKKIWTLYNANRWLFGTNDDGFTVDTYVNKANKL